MHSLFFPDGLLVTERRQRCCSWWRPTVDHCIRSATIANRVAEEWTSSHSGHEVNVDSALRERQVEELHKEEPTPVADVARSGSNSEPRKLRLPP